MKLRYRIQNKSSLISVKVDRPAFDESFHGINPNNPVGGILEIAQKKYIITNYHEFSSSSYSENEFHEKENDWFADVFVNDLH